MVTSSSQNTPSPANFPAAAQILLIFGCLCKFGGVDLCFIELRLIYNIAPQDNRYSEIVRCNNPTSRSTYNSTPSKLFMAYVSTTWPMSPINISERVGTPPHYQVLITTEHIIPDYVFVCVKFPVRSEYYYLYAASSSPGILVFFDLSNPKEIVMPCIVCTSTTLIPIGHISSQSDLANLWDTSNTQNLHGGTMLTSVWNKKPGAVCGISLGRFKETDSSVVCMLNLLSGRYNFTYVSTVGYYIDFNRLIGNMDIRRILNEKFVEHLTSTKSIIYEMKLAEIDFVIVTQFPRAENSIWGVFTPFESSIWWSILVSCVGISIVLQFQGKGLPNNFSGLRSVHDFLLVQSLLFGQAIADEVIKKVKNRKIGLPVLAIWFFVCYILMENLYQGSIYSDLTVIYPPNVPKTFQGLVASNMTIFTTSVAFRSYRDSNRKATSFLKMFIIPEVLMKNFSQRYNKFVNKMNSKMEYIHGANKDVSMVKNMSKFLQIRSNTTSKWVSTRGTFAIMDVLQDLELYILSLRTVGTRLVIQNNADASIRCSILYAGGRNCIAPKIQAFLRHLAETGILGRFKLLEQANRKMHFIKQFGTEIYSKFVAKLNSNFKEVKVFHESWNGNEVEESVGALWHVLALCSVMVAFASVILIWELICKRICKS
ncbi:hypothetical protein Fcan01_16337 [Folsomia candida]|uniref:Uncharacterized protein n=1 Tax=Folsomia candida TaxID=158441 RepID=A0A226DU08_FOLCA|nr:hypothetical protein Fcan01_16337 [Folsomia candida]